MKIYREFFPMRTLIHMVDCKTNEGNKSMKRYVWDFFHLTFDNVI